MAKRKYNICPITGQEVRDRVYNKKAVYSKQGYALMRSQYQRDYHRVYYIVRKIIGIGIVGVQ